MGAEVARPRMTKLWERQRVAIFQAFDEALSDPAVRAQWLETFTLFGIWLQFFIEGDRDRADRVWPRYLDALDRLVPLLQRTPTIAHAFGPQLERWVEASFFEGAGCPLPEPLLPKRLARLLPDNPIELRPDGDLRFYQDANEKHRYQLRDYYRSLRPAGRPGRPRKEHKPKPPGPARLDVDLALRAAQMKEDGAKAHEIADALGVEYSRYHRKDYDRMRKRVARLIERGRLERGPLEHPS